MIAAQAYLSFGTYKRHLQAIYNFIARLMHGSWVAHGRLRKRAREEDASPGLAVFAGRIGAFSNALLLLAGAVAAGGGATPAKHHIVCTLKRGLAAFTHMGLAMTCKWNASALLRAVVHALSWHVGLAGAQLRKV